METDLIGDQVGRIHLGKQDLSGLQTRKMKGLKRERDLQESVDAFADEDIISEDDHDNNDAADDREGGLQVKRMKFD